VEEAIAEAKEFERTESQSGTSAGLSVGDAVRTEQGAHGKVVEIRGDGSVVLLVNNVRLVLPRGARLQPASGAPARSTAAPRPAPREAPVASARVDAEGEAPPASEVDFRGMRIDELEPALEHAIDAAVLADLPYLRIIHGKGTGALRQRVREMLEHDSRVKAFGFAPAQQGGDGVTVVELA
jgi:DNA mismatch repair protein MutS2